MLIRYGTTTEGKRVEIARIYTVEEHGIRRSRIDARALSVTSRLTAAGFQAYVVGGAVRDLLVGKTPKDFDIATDAHPRRVRKLFWSSRIIGKRFRLVHVELEGKIVEVSTFRSLSGQNEFGTIEEDAARRDFTLNALYYSPEKEQIIDYVGGFEDVKARRIRSLLPIDTTFVEDPVRMVRAVKYSVGTGFELPQKLKLKIKKSSGELAQCPASRMTEEIFKILQSGNAAGVFQLGIELDLFPYMLISIDAEIKKGRGKDGAARFLESVRTIDASILAEPEVSRGRMIVALVDPFIALPGVAPRDRTAFTREVFKGIKETIRPITPPNSDVEEAVRLLLDARGLPPPVKPRRRRRRGRQS